MIDAGSAVARPGGRCFAVGGERHVQSTMALDRRRNCDEERAAVGFVSLRSGGADVVDVTGRVLEVLRAPGHVSPRSLSSVVPLVHPWASGFCRRRQKAPGGLTELLSTASEVPAALAGRGLTIAAGSDGEVVAHLGTSKR